MASHVSQGMARPNACVTHGKPCDHMQANGHAYKMGGKCVEKGRRRKERRRKKKRERKERKKGREKEKKKKRWRKGNLHSDSRNSLDQEVKSKGYTPRGKDSSYFGLFSTLRVVWLCLCPKGLFGRISKYGNAAIF